MLKAGAISKQIRLWIKTYCICCYLYLPHD